MIFMYFLTFGHILKFTSLFDFFIPILILIFVDMPLYKGRIFLF